jgi:hypothetical protein
VPPGALAVSGSPQRNLEGRSKVRRDPAEAPQVGDHADGGGES